MMLQRRDTLFRFLHKAAKGGVVVAVFLDDTTGEAGHGCVTAALGNNLGTAVDAFGHIRIEVFCGQVFA